MKSSDADTHDTLITRSSLRGDDTVLFSSEDEVTKLDHPDAFVRSATLAKLLQLPPEILATHATAVVA